MDVRVVLTGAALVLLLAGCGEAATGPGWAAPVASSATATPAPSGDDLGAGWRWESFGNVELQVPEAWGYGTTGSPWCIDGGPGDPYVGRPGPVAAIACAAQVPEGGEDPAYLMRAGGTFVWFQYDTSDALPAPDGDHGDRITLREGEAEIAIQAPADLRNQIASTVRVLTDQDAHGCPITHPISTAPGWRTTETYAAADLDPATAVSACKYTLWDSGQRRARPSSSLISSLELTGDDAAAAVEGTATNTGSGPNDPASCSPDYAAGGEVVVLRIRHGDKPGVLREVVLRYAGCDHHGFDDGVQVTGLTKAGVAPFLTGANEVHEYSGELDGIIPAPGS